MLILPKMVHPIVLRESIDMRERSKSRNASSPIVDKYQFKINCRFKNKKQKDMYNSILDNRITFVRGVAGTGKTMIALLAALNVLKNQDMSIDQIVLTKPIVEVARGKGLGALPGDVGEKTMVHFCHFYDNLIKLIGKDATKFLKESGAIQEIVLNYMRGITLGKYDFSGKPVGSICIFDEAQNSSVSEMKTFISRLGENTKLVIMGDSDQVDIKLANGEKNGLDDAIERLYGMDSISFVEFSEDDIVRDPFLVEIMKRYKYN